VINFDTARFITRTQQTESKSDHILPLFYSFPKADVKLRYSCASHKCLLIIMVSLSTGRFLELGVPPLHPRLDMLPETRIILSATAGRMLGLDGAMAMAAGVRRFCSTYIVSLVR